MSVVKLWKSFICSTRPFLDVTEKKWIVFQLLSALEQCHSVKVCCSFVTPILLPTCTHMSVVTVTLSTNVCTCSSSKNIENCSWPSDCFIFVSWWQTIDFVFQVCHGDIKTENVMVTGWNWVLLTDIASFKPAFLPEDNPADFNFFFDTSRRRSCYIAPERFLDSRQADQLLARGSVTAGNGDSQSNGDPSLPDMDLVRHQQGTLTPEMDIFSAG